MVKDYVKQEGEVAATVSLSWVLSKCDKIPDTINYLPHVFLKIPVNNITLLIHNFYNKTKANKKNTICNEKCPMIR